MTDDTALDEIDRAELDERCAAIADLAEAATDAIDSGVPLDEFIRRPVVAFVNDPLLRVELEKLARNFYDASPAIARGTALRDARCL